MIDRVGWMERGALALARLGVAPPPFPAPFFDAWVGLMAARTVMAAVSLGVIDALDERSDDVEGLAERLDLQPDGVDVLLSALVSLGYVRARRDRFELTRSARRWLASSSPKSLSGWIGTFAYDAWDHFGSLEQVLRSGEPLGLHERDPSDPYWDRYQRGLVELSRMTAEPLARLLPVKDPRRMLDLAGGHGMHAIAMCRRHPGLNATVVELEAPARIGRELVAAEGMADRVEYRAGDLFEIDLGESYDVATANAVLHNLAPGQCVALLTRAREALRPGGTMAVLEAERPPIGQGGSRIATLSGVLFYMLGRTRTWTADELRGYFVAAGFEDVAVQRPVMLNGNLIVTARAP